MYRQIDLLPESIRQRTNKGVRTGRTIASIAIGSVLLVALSFHARYDRDVQRTNYDRAKAEANAVISMEQRIDDLRSDLAELESAYARYRAIVPSIDLSDLTATLVNHLPGSAVLDRLDLHTAGRRSSGRSARDRGSAAGDRSSRQMTIELTGFAPDDRVIASYVGTLEKLRIFDHLTLDYSRTKLVRERPAREFRISLRLDLDRRFEQVQIAGAEAGSGADTP